MKRTDSGLTPDVKAEWGGLHRDVLNIIRRLQSVSRTEGCAILTIRVAVNLEGGPLCWSEPVVTKLEPKASCHVDDLLAALTK